MVKIILISHRPCLSILTWDLRYKLKNYEISQQIRTIYALDEKVNIIRLNLKISSLECSFGAKEMSFSSRNHAARKTLSLQFPSLAPQPAGSEFPDIA